MKESFTKKVLNNFNISRNKISGEFVRNYLLVKKVYARVNSKNRKLSSEKAIAIDKSVNILLKKNNKELENLLPIDIFQSGGGTSVNIPINELICKHSKEDIDPFDDVNMSQSSNDTFPSVAKITSYFQLTDLILQLEDLQSIYIQLVKETKSIKKVGRTHMQDALEITVGDELSVHLETIKKNIKNIQDVKKYCKELPLGATALGSMQNISIEIRRDIIKEVSKEYKVEFKSPQNYFEAVSSSGDLNRISLAISSLASDLLKISKDYILLSSGPKAGLNEIILSESQKGSSIMPGKVNPSIFECMCMICFKILGNSHTIELANQSAQLQLQAFNPIVAFTLFESLEILINGVKMFNQKGISKMLFNKDDITEKLNKSLVYATQYSGILGYEKVAELYKQSLKDNLDLKSLLKKEIKKRK